MDFINTLMPNFERLSEEFYECLYQTIIMVLVSGMINYIRTSLAITKIYNSLYKSSISSRLAL